MRNWLKHNENYERIRNSHQLTINDFINKWVCIKIGTAKSLDTRFTRPVIESIKLAALGKG